MKFSKLLIIVSLFVFSISFAQARDYDWGYSHGCSSAKGHWKKNYDEYRYNYRYARGWNAGKRYCKTRYTKKRRYNKHGLKRVNRYNRNGFKRVDRYKRKSYKTRTYKRRNYNLGYKDGCRTSRYGYTKNRYKFRNIESYRRGWRSGRRNCR